ncbi:MAG: thiol peroxidase [Proteobacteria bacterium]|jgi:thiol peroxidase|nr:thiol peroxidase [Litorivicinaceae bacterium]MDA0894890.1 thiol peroxidase [Pseudomonadota bacterium]
MSVTISHRGDMIEVDGGLPAVGAKAPEFSLVANDLSEITLASYAGKHLILNIFPSIDTPTCAQSTRRFNEELSSLADTHVLCVSADLPFAQSRFCGAEGLERVETGSTFRSSFSDDYGVTILSGKLTGLTTRAVVVIGPDAMVKHVELVPEIGQEPDYAAALAAL